MSSAIDTLKIYERLKDADLSDKAAKEIAEVFKDAIEDHLAAKKDLTVLKSELEAVIANAKVEIIKWVAGMLVAQAVIIAAMVKLL